MIMAILWHTNGFPNCERGVQISLVPMQYLRAYLLAKIDTIHAMTNDLNVKVYEMLRGTVDHR